MKLAEPSLIALPIVIIRRARIATCVAEERTGRRRTEAVAKVLALFLEGHAAQLLSESVPE